MVGGPLLIEVFPMRSLREAGYLAIRLEGLERLNYGYTSRLLFECSIDLPAIPTWKFRCLGVASASIFGASHGR